MQRHCPAAQQCPRRSGGLADRGWRSRRKTQEPREAPPPQAAALSSSIVAPIPASAYRNPASTQQNVADELPHQRSKKVRKQAELPDASGQAKTYTSKLVAGAGVSGS